MSRAGILIAWQLRQPLRLIAGDTNFRSRRYNLAGLRAPPGVDSAHQIAADVAESLFAMLIAESSIVDVGLEMLPKQRTRGGLGLKSLLKNKI